MKRFLVLFSAVIFVAGCASNLLPIFRGPSSVASALSKTKGTTSTTKNTVDTFLKYYLAKNQTFEKINPQDCKAYIQENQALCKTDECKAIVTEQDFRCVDQTCKALLNSREEFCVDEACKALVTNQPELCKADDPTCRSVVKNEGATCAPGTDCKAYLDKRSFDCKSNQCKAFVNENMNFCEMPAN